MKGKPALMEDRETTGINVDGKVVRLTGIGFTIWLTLARLNVVKGAKSLKPASLQQLANRLAADGRITTWQTHYDTARWYVWKFKKLGIVKEVDTDAASLG